ncbi:MAG TPA: hypothetical protein DD381_06640 [Lentisphaeria bacterium]|nr:MAG: hypothetical protein A2X47_13140 [Lentisphaerae bacterium GWF2_38_69]HBM16003.1 hypothetical protein [Lentisphaeria bacterium]
MPEKYKNLLFDLDGTIIDPKEGITTSIQYALKKLGAEKIPSSDELTWGIGPSLVHSFPKLFGKEDKELAQKCVEYYREYFSKKGIFQCFLYDGIKDILTELSTSSKLFLATSKPGIFALQILELFELKHLFTGVYGSEFDGRFMNKADLIAHLLKIEKLNVSECLMIGDRKHDIIGAKVNNMESCGVLWGYGSRKELSEAGVSFLVEKPEGLLKLK